MDAEEQCPRSFPLQHPLRGLWNARDPETPIFPRFPRALENLGEMCELIGTLGELSQK